jgi:hypothetical protein
MYINSYDKKCINAFGSCEKPNWIIDKRWKQKNKVDRRCTLRLGIVWN